MLCFACLPVHYYNYIKDSMDGDQYPITRFASEYGFQALPSIWTMLSATADPDKDLQPSSEFMRHRQHLPGGNLIMQRLIKKNFVIPRSNDTLRAFMDYAYLSQVMQAASMRIQTESYRQTRSFVNDLGEGITMGALYWQLNDVWQGPSWSSIDFQGRWKMLHHYAKDFFSPVIVASKINEANELSLYVVSDLLRPLPNSTVHVNVYEWKSSRSIRTELIENVTIGPSESKLVARYWIDDFLERAGCGSLSTAKENCFIELALTDGNGKGTIAPRNYVYPCPLKRVPLPDDSLAVEKIQLVSAEPTAHADVSRPTFQIELISENIALFVWLEIGDVRGRFSENGFHILRGKKLIRYQAFQPVSLEYIHKNLIVTSLSRIYDTDRRASDARIVIDRLTAATSSLS